MTFGDFWPELPSCRPEQLTTNKRLLRAPLCPTLPIHTHTAAALFGSGGRGPATVRKLIDCLIAATAIRLGISVLHADSDFDVLARHTDLQIDAL